MAGETSRGLFGWSRWHRQCCSRATFYHLFSSPSLLSPINTHQRLFITGIPSSHRSVHFRSRGLKLPDALVASDFADTDSDSDSNVKKSRNEKKREARRAVRWAMDLAAFSPPQIKRILRVASLETELFDALMLVKLLGRDVREGKRRQFNYIEYFLCPVTILHPILVDLHVGQELCRLLRKVYSLQEHEVASEENAEEYKALMGAKRSLIRFLRAIAKQLPIE